jgi:hypothetical protein
LVHTANDLLQYIAKMRLNGWTHILLLSNGYATSAIFLVRMGRTLETICLRSKLQSA